MPNKQVIDKYNEVLAVILYVKTATTHVTADRVSEYVTGTTPATTRRLLRAMVSSNMLSTSMFGRTTTYHLTDETKSIYGD